MLGKYAVSIQYRNVPDGQTGLLHQCRASVKTYVYLVCCCACSQPAISMDELSTLYIGLHISTTSSSGKGNYESAVTWESTVHDVTLQKLHCES